MGGGANGKEQVACVGLPASRAPCHSCLCPCRCFPAPPPTHRALKPTLHTLCAGLELAKQCGLQQSDLVDVIKLGAIASPMFQLKASKGGGSPALRAVLCCWVRSAGPGTSPACMFST
jgi:hypothetical protein